MSLAPPPESLYTSHYLAFQAIQPHAKHHGYAVYKAYLKTSRLLIACDRAGQYDARGKDPEVHESRQRKAIGTKKCGCLMRVEVRQDPALTQWIVRVLEWTHNHRPSAAPSAHPAHRNAAATPEIHTEICTLAQAGLAPSQVLTVLRAADPESPLIQKDVGNIIHQERLIDLNVRTPLQWLLEVREEAHFDYFTNI
jgi:hypothetical protein